MRLASGLLALLLPLMVAAPLRASDDIEVRAASAALRGTVLEVTMHAEYPADEELRAALEAGASVDLGLQVVIEKTSQYWFNEGVLEKTLRRELSWNAPSQRYVLKDTSSNEQQTFATFEAALLAAGTVESWPVQLDRQLDPKATYEISVRARLRRGRLPTALRALTFWTRYWNRSEWYTWVLPR
jgi:hypothetical protein